MAHSSNLGEIHQETVAPVPEIDRSHPDHYLNYWESLASSTRVLSEDMTFRNAAQATQERLRQLDNDLGFLAEEEANGDIESVIAWYSHLGSLNELEGAEGSLENAAEILFRTIDDGTYVEHYSQSRLYMLGANLFHEMLLLNGRQHGFIDEELSKSYCAIAQENYQKAMEAEGGNPLSTRTIRATQGWFDVEYELLHQNWPLTPVRHNEENPERLAARRTYRSLLQEEVESILDVIDEISEKHNSLELQRIAEWERGNKKHAHSLAKQMHGESDRTAGTLLEWFAPLIFRYALHRSGQEEEATIRRSLIREEEPRFKKAQQKARKGRQHKKTQSNIKQSVDAVVARFEHGYYVESTPYQYKTGKSSRHEYLPHITIIDNFRQRVDDFMLEEFANRNTPEERNARLLLWMRKASEFMYKNLDAESISPTRERDYVMFEDFVDLVQSDLDAA